MSLSIDYNWVDGAETLARYQPGGYHPIEIGNLVHERYVIVDKLGFGSYSTVWLAWDTHQEQYVALKVGTASESEETRALKNLSIPSTHPGRDSIPSPLDEFEIHGPNGIHPCYTMILAQGDLRVASRCRLFPLAVARALVGGILMAIQYMHSCGYVHGDLWSFLYSDSSQLICHEQISTSATSW